MKSLAFVVAALLALTLPAKADQTFIHVTNGVVDNAAVFPDSGLPANWPDRDNWQTANGAQIGWTCSNGTCAAPAPPAPPARSTNPADYPLQRYQFDAMLDIAGLKPLITPAIASITDPVQRAVAQAKYDDTQVFNRTDPLLNQLAAAAGLTSAQVDAYWMQANGL